MALTGTNFVRFTRHGLQAAKSLWPKTGDRYEVRRQVLKLRWWDDRHLHSTGMLMDLSYEAIKTLSGLGIYELRLDDRIGGHENIRTIVFDPPKDWQPLEIKPMRVIWILEIFPKKRDAFTTYDIKRFKCSRLLLAQRCYGR